MDRERCAPGRAAGRWRPVGALAREWVLLEALGHAGLIALRQICGTWWSWETGGPFAYLDVSRAMLHGDFLWVVAVVCTSAIRLGLLAEWGGQLAARRAFGARAWLPWVVPGALAGWLALIRGDSGAAYILALPYGAVFEGFHILFFGYVAARGAACALQLAVAAPLLLRHGRHLRATRGPGLAIPLGVTAAVGLVLLCAAAYLHIYRLGGSFRAHWTWLSLG